jgi:hypothetical protein
MRLGFSILALNVALLSLASVATAQRHDAGSSPPTAPPVKPTLVAPPVAPIAPIASAMGALQFYSSDYGVSAPQSLARQMQSSDDRIRAAALSAIGAPAQYTGHGHAASAHSVHLDFLPLGDSDEIDAILTVELDQHMVSAILMPQNDEWHRIATITFATAFTDTATTPSMFLRTDRSLLNPLRYTAIFHAVASRANGDFSESEAHLRVLNGHAVITLSFTSAERDCDAATDHPCAVVERWLQADASDPAHRFLLVTATGHVKTKDAGDPIATAETYETAHLRSFTCQPLMYSASALHFEPSGAAAPCIAPQAAQIVDTLHPASATHPGTSPRPN